MHNPPLLPVRDKSRLTRGWTYPIGAEIVSQALAGLPQYDATHLRFLTSGTFHDTEKDSYFVLSGYYTNPATTRMERNSMVDVCAVPSAIAPEVRTILVTDGLPILRAWMEAQRDLIWYESTKYVSIRFHPDGPRLTTSEHARP